MSNTEKPKTYTVVGISQVTWRTVVEARTQEEAYQKAQMEDPFWLVVSATKKTIVSCHTEVSLESPLTDPRSLLQCEDTEKAERILGAYTGACSPQTAVYPDGKVK